MVKKISDLVKKIFLVAAKQVSRPAMPNKLQFIFGPANSNWTNSDWI